MSGIGSPEQAVKNGFTILEGSELNLPTTSGPALAADVVDTVRAAELTADEVTVIRPTRMQRIHAHYQREKGGKHIAEKLSVDLIAEIAMRELLRDGPLIIRGQDVDQ